MTDNDNKDPQITADAAIAIAYTNDIKKLMAKNKQQAAELKQLKGEAASMDIVVIENKAYMPWPKHMGIRGNLANRIGELEAELKQLRAERAGLNEEALDNASTLAFYLFDQQGWDLGELSAEEITKRIIQRYLEIAKLTDSAQRGEG